MVVAAGVVVNFALAWFCIFGSVSTGGIVQPHYEPGLLVNQVHGDERREYLSTLLLSGHMGVLRARSGGGGGWG